MCQYFTEARKLGSSVSFFFMKAIETSALVCLLESYTFGSRRITYSVIFPVVHIASLRIPTPGFTKFLIATLARTVIVRRFLVLAGRSPNSDRLFHATWCTLMVTTEYAPWRGAGNTSPGRLPLPCTAMKGAK